MRQFTIVVATQDWHPHNHVSFASMHPGEKAFTEITINGRKQILWPDHCIAGTAGADFHPFLKSALFTHIVRKAYMLNEEAYSGFPKTGLAAMLVWLNIKHVFVCGLATDYCVKATALDAVERNFNVSVILPACRGVTPKTTATAIQEMRAAGIDIIEEL